MPFIDTNAVPPRDPLPGWHGRFFHTEHMTFAYYEIDADAVALHEHEHPQEEVWNVIDGELALTIDGAERIAGAGCAAVVPAHTRHSARAITECRAIVVDSPVRDQVGGVSTS